MKTFGYHNSQNYKEFEIQKRLEKMEDGRHVVISALGKPTVTTKYIYKSQSSSYNLTFSYEVALCDSTNWQNDSGRYDKVEQVRQPLQQHYKELKAHAKYPPYKNQGQFR